MTDGTDAFDPPGLAEPKSLTIAEFEAAVATRWGEFQGPHFPAPLSEQVALIVAAGNPPVGLVFYYVPVARGGIVFPDKLPIPSGLGMVPDEARAAGFPFANAILKSAPYIRRDDGPTFLPPT